MDRKRSIATATGMSAVLIAGSSAMAYANGIFASPRSEHAGSYAEMQAQLTPETTRVAGRRARGATPPANAAGRLVALGIAGVGSVPPDTPASPAPRPAAPPRSAAPPTMPTRSDGPAHEPTDEPSTVPAPQPVTAPTTVPSVAPVTTTTIAHSGPSTVTTQPGDAATTTTLPGGNRDD